MKSAVSPLLVSVAFCLVAGPALASLGSALDAPGLAWSTSYTTGGGTVLPGGWMEAAGGVDGGPCVASPMTYATTRDTAGLSTTITGPATLVYWVKFAPDTVGQGFNTVVTPAGNLTALTDWVEQTVALPAGSNTVTWRISRNSEVPRAWVDQVHLASDPRPFYHGPRVIRMTAGVPAAHTLGSWQPATQWQIPALPPGLALNQGTGLISGTPTTPGLYPVQVSATNAAGSTAMDLSLFVSANTPDALDLSAASPLASTGPWTQLAAAASHDGIDALQVIAPVAPAAAATLKFAVRGPGVFQFWERTPNGPYTTSSESRLFLEGVAAPIVYVNPATQAWTLVQRDIPAGDMTWTYWLEGAGGANRAFQIDEVTVGASTKAWSFADWAEFWRINRGPSGFYATPDPAGDPDGDGRTNLLEYALGTSPIRVDALPPVGLAVVSGAQQLTWMRPNRPTNAACVVKHSSSPAGPWTTSGIATVTDTPDRLTVSCPVITRDFFRLEAAYTP